MNEQQLRVLLVDDEWSLREPLAKHLRDTHGYHVDTAADAKEALQLVAEAERPYDVALIDDLLTPQPGVEPESIGIELMARIRECCPEMEYIIFTGWGVERALAALRAGAYRYLAKPFNLDELGMIIRVAAEHRRLKRQLESTERELRLLTSIYEASSAIISPLDPDQALRAVVEQARRALNAWRASVVLIDEAGQPQHLTATGFEKDMSAYIRPDGISMRVIKTDKPYVIENVMAQREQVHPGMVEDGVGAAVCLPLTLREKTIGVMWIHYREPRSFSEAEIEALRIYTNQAAIAYDNARRMRELEHMRQAAEVMAAPLALRQVLQRIVESARQVLQADSAAIWSYDNMRNQFIPDELVTDGIPENELEKFRTEEPRKGRTADAVMRVGWVGVTDISDSRYKFIGASSRDLLGNIGIKSFQGIALKVGDENLGVLYVNYNRLRSFSEDDRKTLETFASHAALALKKARLLDQVSEARDRARVVAELSVLEDLQSTLDSVVRGTQDVLGCDVVTLYTYDQIRDEFGFPPAMVGVRDIGEVVKLGLVARDSGVGRILALDEAYVAEDAPSDPVVDGAFVKREEIKSSVGIPLKVSDRKVGVMFVSYRSRHRFTTDELTNIKLFANQAAVAIRNAQLYQAEQRHGQALKAIQATSAAVSAVLELDVLLPMITEKAAEIFAAPATSLMLWDERREHLVIRAAFGVSDEYRQRQQISRSTVRELIEERGLGQHVFDMSHEPIGEPELVKSERLYSVLSTPLTIGSELIGILNVYSKDEPRWFGEKEKELAAIFANHAAIAIQNAHSYEELKRTKGLVGARTALAWMGMVSTAWRHAIGGYATTIRDWVAVTRLDLERGAPVGKLQERLDDIEKAARKIMETPITAPLSAEEGVESVSVNTLVRERVRQLWHKEPQKSVQIRLDFALDDTATTRAGREWLRRVLDILVDNAVEAMAESTVKQLTVATRLADGGAEIAITDTGRGIPENVLPKLFQEPIRKPKGVSGLGVGLLLAQTIVQTYGGEIRVASTGPTGTTMVIWLPIEQ